MHVPLVVVLTNVIAPYRAEFYRQLSRETAWDIHFLFYGHPRFEKQWPIVLTDIRGEKLPRFFVGETAINPTLMRRLRQLRPRLIVCSGASTQSLTALRYARSHNIPLLVWWGGTAQSEATVKSLKRWWRTHLFHRADAFFAYSTLAADFIRESNVSKPIYVLGNNTMDARAWRERVQAARAPAISSLPIVVGAGQLVPRKNYAAAIRTMAREPRVQLALVGTGSEEQSLRELAREQGVEQRVRFMGNVPHPEMPSLLAQAAAFFHPARSDQWPQVINEAMAAGLPVLVSSESGIPTDFVRDGVNGFVRRADDDAAWAECLRRLVDNPSLAAQMSQAALATALANDIHFALAEFKRGLQETLRQ